VLLYEHKKAVPRNARYYDSDTGRFISPDPTVPDPIDTQAYNRYMFVQGNPISFVDMDGYRLDESGTGSLPEELSDQEEEHYDRDDENSHERDDNDWRETVDTSQREREYRQAYNDKMVEENGGPRFSTIDDAARDFSNKYNDDSIRNNREYGATVYRDRNQYGSVHFKYTVPKKGGVASVIPPSLPPGFPFTRIDAIVHTHGRYDKAYDDPNGRDGNNNFSDADIGFSEFVSAPIYVATPNGSFQRYNHHTNVTRVLSTDMPSDPDDPGRLNNISPYQNLNDNRCK
jgi:RHS repeat-associated protein